MNHSSKPKAFRASLGAFIVLVATIGSALAANIGIGNSDKGSEFGQGVFTIKACDTWIQLNLVAGATGQNGAPAGLSALTGINLEGLMPTQCRSTKFTLQALDSNGKVLPLYRTDQTGSLCSTKPFCVIGKNSESDLILVISSTGSVSLSNPDTYHQLSYNSTTGSYTFSFTQPGQLAQTISTLTVQSSAL
jgi:hypothetical protein